MFLKTNTTVIRIFRLMYDPDMRFFLIMLGDRIYIHFTDHLKNQFFFA
jgi:hypothetical protein